MAATALLMKMEEPDNKGGGDPPDRRQHLQHHHHRQRSRRSDGSAAASFPSPSSSSSSDFEFSVSLSPASRQFGGAENLCPADELFYKGKLLPLHLSPRISMVRTLLLASSSTSSSDAPTTASRDSNGSTSSSSSSAIAADFHLLAADCDAAPTSPPLLSKCASSAAAAAAPGGRRRFTSLAIKFSAVFRPHRSKRSGHQQNSVAASPSSAAKEMIRKCVNKMKPIYEKLQSPLQQRRKKCSGAGAGRHGFGGDLASADGGGGDRAGILYGAHSSFSGNLMMHPRRRKCAGSCPSSMRSSPNHSGLLYGSESAMLCSSSSSSSSSMEELQNAIQGAIAHCKSTLAHANLMKIAQCSHS